VLQDSAIQKFHTDVAHYFARAGRLRLYSLRVHSRIIAVLYAFANFESTYFYLSGFDPEFEKISPGTILIGHAIERAIEEGHRAFNFLRGSEPYKYSWGAQDQETFRCVIDAREKHSDTP
jgi:CelD/BcsL family acetyltransferase involved in cellulose biosynthesis